MKSFPALALLASMATAQIPDFVPDDLKGDEETDERLSDIWPKKTIEAVDVMPMPLEEINKKLEAKKTAELPETTT